MKAFEDYRMRHAAADFAHPVAVRERQIEASIGFLMAKAGHCQPLQKKAHRWPEDRPLGMRCLDCGKSDLEAFSERFGGECQS